MKKIGNFRGKSKIGKFEVRYFEKGMNVFDTLKNRMILENIFEKPVNQEVLEALGHEFLKGYYIGIRENLEEFGLYTHSEYERVGNILANLLNITLEGDR